MTVETWLRLTILGGGSRFVKKAPYQTLVNRIPEDVKKLQVVLDSRYPLMLAVEHSYYIQGLGRDKYGDEYSLQTLETASKGGASRYIDYWDWLNYIRWVNLTFRDNKPLADFLIENAVRVNRGSLLMPISHLRFSQYVEDLEKINPLMSYNSPNLLIPKEICGVSFDVLRKTVHSGIIKEFI